MTKTFSITMAGAVFTSGPFLDDEYVHESLLQKHLFPNVKDDTDEIPPIFTSQSLTTDLSNEIFDLLKTDRKYKTKEEVSESFSPMRYTSLKFNGSVRTIQVPHPIAYMRLAHQISANWTNIEGVLESSSSRIRPKIHEDGRLVSMDYGDKTAEAIEESSRLVGTQYVVQTDIANCFPSIYTHAIDWAIREKTNSKKDRGRKHWASQVDMRVRDVQDGETMGVGIGPGTSNVVTEIILQRIDISLEQENHRFTRHIDDYRCYAETKSEAERFLYDLIALLYDYRLTVNHRKTLIRDINNQELEPWLHDVRSCAIDPGDPTLTMIRKLRTLQELARKYPSISILKYGVRSMESIVPKLEKVSLHGIVPELARMIWIAPYLTAKVVKHVVPHLERDHQSTKVLIRALEKTIVESARRRQADVYMWSLYGLYRLGYSPADQDIFDSIYWNPVTSATGLALFPDQTFDKVLEGVKSLSTRTGSLLDEQWLLRYQLWLCGALVNSDLDKSRELNFFTILGDRSVDFIRLDHQDSAES